jgi:hypothetical protein
MEMAHSKQLSVLRAGIAERIKFNAAVRFKLKSSGVFAIHTGVFLRMLDVLKGDKRSMLPSSASSSARVPNPSVRGGAIPWPNRRGENRNVASGDS